MTFDISSFFYPTETRFIYSLLFMEIFIQIVRVGFDLFFETIIDISFQFLQKEHEYRQWKKAWKGI